MLRASPRLPIRARLSAAWKQFRFPGHSGGGGYGSPFGFGGYFGLSPGSRYNFAKESSPVWLNGVVLAAVNWFALTWAEAPLVVYRPRRNDKPELLKEHPALDLLAHPNPYYDDTILWGGSMLSLLTAGNGYWAKEYAAAGNVIQLNYIPDFMIEPYWPKDGSDYISGYVYRVDGQTIRLPRDRVVQLRWPVPDPGNQRKGLSPLAAELKAIAIDNEVSNYTASILRNMGIPGGVISPEGEADIQPEQAETIKRLFTERFTGDNRGTPMVMSLPVKLQTIAFSPEQMALGSIVGQPIPRICAALRIDPMVLGYDTPRQTYSNMTVAIKAAYERTLIPLHRAVDSQMTEQIMPWVVGAAEGDYFGRDYSEVPALREDNDALYKRLTAATGGSFLSVNEAREQIGLQPIEGGDELRQPKAPGMPGDNEQGSLPRAASLSPAQASIAAKWRQRALAAPNGHR